MNDFKNNAYGILQSVQFLTKGADKSVESINWRC